VSDVFCLTMTPVVSGADVSVDLSWFEIV